LKKARENILMGIIPN